MKKSTALPSSDGIGPSAASCGSDAASSGGGNDAGTAATTSGPSAWRPDRRPFTRSTKAGSWIAPGPEPATTNVSEIESSCSCCCLSSCCACLASGVFVKSKSVVSDPANSVDNDTIAATSTRNQTPTVLHGW